MTIEIIVPGRFIDAKDPLNFQVQAEGIFTLEAIKDGVSQRAKVFRETAPFKNLITNQGLDIFYETIRGDGYSSCHVGTGTTPPAFTDTTLANKVGGTISLTGTLPPAGVAPDYYSELTISGTSAVGAFGNNNLTEIGVGDNSGELFSRALIVDVAGNPTAFPIGEDEQLRVTYQLRLYPPLEDAVFDVDVSGPRVATVRALRIASAGAWSIQRPVTSGSSYNLRPGTSLPYTGGLAENTAYSPLGSSLTSSNAIDVTPYQKGTHKVQHRVSWNSGSFNSDNARTFMVEYSTALFQVEYDPPISKNNEQTLYLDFELSWGRR